VALGGSGTIEEINNKVYEIEKISDDIQRIPHGTGEAYNEVEYRLAWSKTYLKKYGLLENSSRGVWALTRSNVDISSLNSAEIVREVRKQSRPSTSKNMVPVGAGGIENEVEDGDEWKERLLNVLYAISPAAFERLAQRILRESGFSQVEVTGKTGDGGIDGKGIVRISGLLSFHVIFQCKRYKGSITPNQIRDFRGAMQGRADKGLFITTGRFTKEAIKEATRDGAPPIDLIDGELLSDKLLELKLGVGTMVTETVVVNNEWFDSL